MKEDTYIETSDRGKDISANILSMKDLQIAKWQRIAAGMLACTILSTAGLVYTATKATFIPYVVGVDEHGKATAIGALTEVDHEPTDAEIRYFLSRTIEQVRTVPADSQVLQDNFSRAAMYFDKNSLAKYKQLYLPDITSKIEKGELNRVTIVNVLPIKGSNNSYQVSWIEKSKNVAGKPTEQAYTGTFTIAKEKVDDKEILMNNPLGLFIKDFSLQEDAVKK